MVDKKDNNFQVNIFNSGGPPTLNPPSAVNESRRYTPKKSVLKRKTD